jgi:hypothetical protein
MTTMRGCLFHIDTGSSTNILYKTAFELMKIDM